MTELLTDFEFQATVKETRTQGKIKSAAYQVLVMGRKSAHVAKDFGITRQAVSTAVKKIKELYQSQQTPEGCRLVKVWLPYEQADEIEKQCRKKQTQE